MDTLSVIRLMPSNREEMEDFVAKTIMSIRAGEMSEVEAKRYVKSITETMYILDQFLKV